MIHNLEPGQKIAVSDLPQYAPLNYAELGTFEGIHDDGYSSTSVGSGIYTNLKCEACGYGGKDLPDSEKNHCIYFYKNMERNGNYSTRSEIVCTKCGKYTVVETFEVG
jgi:hypothetical protein